MQTQSGTVAGRGHIVFGKNCQDSSTLLRDKLGFGELVVGVVCDGCSDGESSEVGAKLASRFIAETARNYVGKMPLKHIPAVLFVETLGFIESTLSQFRFSDPADELEFFDNHMLFTILGVICYGEDAVVFRYGDGVTVLDNEIIEIKQYPPEYIGYRLLEDKKHEFPDGFDVIRVDPNVRRIAIGSDAWIDEIDLLGEIWDFDHPNGLQRKMNIWSKKEHRFSDDASIITVVRR